MRWCAWCIASTGISTTKISDSIGCSIFICDFDLCNGATLYSIFRSKNDFFIFRCCCLFPNSSIATNSTKSISITSFFRKIISIIIKYIKIFHTAIIIKFNPTIWVCIYRIRSVKIHINSVITFIGRIILK